MSNRMQRLEVLRVILGSSNTLSSHEEILRELSNNGLKEQITQIVNDVLSDNSARHVTITTEEDLKLSPPTRKRLHPHPTLL